MSEPKTPKRETPIVAKASAAADRHASPDNASANRAIGRRLPLVAAHDRAEKASEALEKRWNVERPASIDRPTRLRQNVVGNQGRLLLLDGFAGLAGDMLLGALVDLGVNLGIDLAALRAAIESLGVPGLRVEAHDVIRAHLGATKVSIACAEHEEHRHLGDIEAIIRASELGEAVQEDAIAVFHRLAYAEALAHRVSISEIHFHEVGASDAIADICGVTWALHHLNVAGIASGPLPAGSGTVRCAHGVMPVPVPAVLHLLPDFTLLAGQGRGEMVTPTGAALLATFGVKRSDSALPKPYQTLATGYGAGTRESSVLRLTLADTSSLADFGLGPIGESIVDVSSPWRSESVVVLRANIDDMTAEHLGFALDEMFRAGALDAWIAPIAMKKNRTAHEFCCMCRDDAATRNAVTAAIFRHTSTLGLRCEKLERVFLPREIIAMPTAVGEIRIKSWTFGEERRFSAEYDDCVAAARVHGKSIAFITRVANEAAKAYFAKEQR